MISIFCLDGQVGVVERLEVGLPLVEHGEHLVGHRLAARPALRPHFAERRARTPLLAGREHRRRSPPRVSLVNRLSATTGGTPNFWMFLTCASRLTMPFLSAATSGVPRFSFLTPPCILSARTVATTTAASGLSPPKRHLMSKNFSAPRSAPKPASVRTMSPRRQGRASWPSRSCSRARCCRTGRRAPAPARPRASAPGSGRMASLSSSVMAPAALSSPAVTGFRSRV